MRALGKRRQFPPQISGRRSFNPYLFRHLASQISSHLQTITGVPNWIHSWLNLAPSATVFCVIFSSGNRNAFLCKGGGKGYPATENLIGQYPIKANTQKNKLQSRWQRRFPLQTPPGVVYPKNAHKNPFYLSGKCCNISGMARHNGKRCPIARMRSIPAYDDGLWHDQFRLEFLLWTFHTWWGRF